jgi:hypothetical protein
MRLGSITPFFNNTISLVCGILLFSTVFSVQREQGATTEEIVQTLRYNGPANTGLTFIWYIQHQVRLTFSLAVIGHRVTFITTFDLQVECPEHIKGGSGDNASNTALQRTK